MLNLKLWLYVGVAVLVFGAGYGLAHLQATAAIAKLERAHSESMGNIRKQKEAETQKVRDTEKQLNSKADETRAFHEKQLTQRDTIIEGLRTTESRVRDTNVGLRRDLAAYLTRKPAADPGCPSDPRPAALGLLLDEAIGVIEANNKTAGELAEGAERHADEVRTLKQYALTVCRAQ